MSDDDIEIELDSDSDEKVEDSDSSTAENIELLGNVKDSESIPDDNKSEEDKVNSDDDNISEENTVNSDDDKSGGDSKSKTKPKKARVISDSEESKSATKPKAKAKKTKKVKSTVKKGPGRPRKIPKKEPIPRKGIAKSPTSSDDHIELLYEHPELFKKVFQQLKQLAASQVQVLFRPKDIIFYSVDHHKKTRIRIKINASKLNHYYCKSDLDIGIRSKDMELILNKVNKDYNSIIILSAVGSTQRTITIVLENDMQIDEKHDVSVIAQYDKMENEDAFIDEDYTIKFQLPSRYFRKMISDIKTMSNKLGIVQEDSESPLTFEYLNTNKKINSKHTVKNSEKISLESSLEEDESFRVDVRIEYIKPISAAQIADAGSITIMVDEEKEFMTKACIDNGTIEIKTLTEIIDERPEDVE
jgi:hypothetical protein